MKICIPPIKSQGIKTKLVPWIAEYVPHNFNGIWIEPFMGTGVVAFNLAPQNALLCDTNPHLINFYQSIQNKSITPCLVRKYLEKEGQSLLSKGEEHYYFVRNRFNNYHEPLDFLFLNRAGFNGMIRFNRNGKFNIPFCHKPNRFAKSYITKIVNQVDNISQIIEKKRFQFICQEFEKTISLATNKDIIYCDPPYIDRHVDYFNSWNEDNERKLYDLLSKNQSKFILSTWSYNSYRKNQYIQSLWCNFEIHSKEHFYHVGAKESNRNTMMEAIIKNFSHTNVAKNNN
ncbi:DNA adenine methylase [Bartonella sp. B17]